MYNAMQLLLFCNHCRCYHSCLANVNLSAADFISIKLQTAVVECNNVSELELRTED